MPAFAVSGCKHVSPRVERTTVHCSMPKPRRTPGQDIMALPELKHESGASYAPRSGDWLT